MSEGGGAGSDAQSPPPLQSGHSADHTGGPRVPGLCQPW